MKFHATFFDNYAATSKHERRVTLPQLADRIAAISRPTKDQLPWLKLACFGDRRTLKNSLRHDANVKWVSGCEGDYDGERMPFDEAVDIAEKICVLAIIYTSPSHTEDAPRWRILCPFSLGLAPDKRRHMLGRINGAFRGIFSRESWTLSQSFYFGSVADNPSHRVREIYGHTLDQLDDLDDEGWIGPPSGGGATGTLDDVSPELRGDAELIRCCVTAEHLHVELCALAARYIGRGIPAQTVVDILRGLMLSVLEARRDTRWHDRYESISELVKSAMQKYGGEQIEARRAIARLTWRMAEASRPGDEIKAAVLATAERVGIDPDKAINIAAGILREVMKEPRYA